MHGRVGQSHNLPLGSPAVSHVIDGGSGRVVRLSTRELSGAASAVFRLWDGHSAGSTLIDTISLSAAQSTRDYYRAWEYPYDVGLFLEVVSGSFEGVAVVQHHYHGDVIGEPVIIVASEVGIVELPLVSS